MFDFLGVFLLLLFGAALVWLIRSAWRAKKPVVSPPAGATVSYGAYVSSITCDGCHGADLLGQPQFGTPPLVAIPVAWNEQQFIDFMRSGIRPDGTSVEGDTMPWEEMSELLAEDDEMRAVYACLHDVVNQ